MGLGFPVATVVGLLLSDDSFSTHNQESFEETRETGMEFFGLAVLCLNQPVSQRLEGWGGGSKQAPLIAECLRHQLYQYR
ncbi:unnamed protein product [Schistocephalus solidus]|uniref:Secreted protein n=1 Tax=Schistocephalus solidus TaxID=70667 RepID=A0A183T4Z2_SCHSO|nr:unnamed protein product [Schistocephalus solidus]